MFLCRQMRKINLAKLTAFTVQQHWQIHERKLMRSHTSNYTERQKKLITSSEWHLLKSTASKWFIFGHRLGKFILNKHIKKEEVYFNQSGNKRDEISRGKFSKITETACLSGWEFEADKSLYGVYVTRHWNWMFWIGHLRRARSEFTRWAVSAISKKWPFVI